jgi:hypothetical protein
MKKSDIVKALTNTDSDNDCSPFVIGRETICQNHYISLDRETYWNQDVRHGYIYGI